MILSTIFFILQILPTFFCLLFYSLKEKRAYEHTYITHVKRLVIYIKRIEFHNPMSSPLTVFLAMIRFETFIPFYLKRNEYTYTYPWKHALLVTFIFVLCNSVLDQVFILEKYLTIPSISFWYPSNNSLLASGKWFLNP